MGCAFAILLRNRTWNGVAIWRGKKDTLGFAFTHWVFGSGAWRMGRKHDTQRLVLHLLLAHLFDACLLATQSSNYLQIISSILQSLCTDLQVVPILLYLSYETFSLMCCLSRLSPHSAEIPHPITSTPSLQPANR